VNPKSVEGSTRQLLCLPRYGPGMGSSRVRFHEYLSALETGGWRVTFKPLQNDAFHLARKAGKARKLTDLLRDYARRLSVVLQAKAYDAVWIEKELLPYLPSTAERWLVAHHVPVIVDYDDATFHVYDEHRSAVVRRAFGRKIDAVMRAASLTVTGNAYLAERAVRAGAPTVKIIPSSVDSARYLLEANRLQSRAADTQPVIGWIGSPSTAKYLRLIGPVLSHLQRATHARVVLVGSGHIEIPDVTLELLPWSESTEVGLIQSFDVGIMPIARTNWERGKCGFKLIQYMAAGVPTVATAFGANTEITLHGRTGFLANTHDEWVGYLSELLSNKTLATTMGLKGRERVRDEYSVQANAPKLVAAFEQVLRESRHKGLAPIPFT
jgi:glycosyltransferase involved in cell wall biosynthesis